MKKQYIDVPLPRKSGGAQLFWHRISGVVLTPFYLIAAQLLRTPGIGTHIKCAVLGLRLFLSGRISLQKTFLLIFYPLDSTRYVEFHETLKMLKSLSFVSYLDVSSPRLLPALLLLKNKEATAELVNPDGNDLKETQELMERLNLTKQCRFRQSTIAQTDYKAGTFDLLTCISVLEHIPEDKKAVERMWSLLRRGGRMILTAPCMAEPMEQYMNQNDYGVLSPEANGYTFWQRFYDDARLESAVFAVTGKPSKTVIYGEKKYGSFYKNTAEKYLLRQLYPFWKEPFMMGNDYRYFQELKELPGEGVVIFEFIKS